MPAKKLLQLPPKSATPRHFSTCLNSVSAIWDNYKKSPVSLALSPLDDMFQDTEIGPAEYQAVGLNAIEIILTAMLTCGKSDLNSILDMPCGFGRVSRHLSAAFPTAKLYCCDLYNDRIDFCAENFGAAPIKSNQDFEKVQFPDKFDLIWCGSLLTHLLEHEFRKCIKLFVDSLADGGFAIFTTLGRYSPYCHHNIFEYLNSRIYAESDIEGQFKRTGYGYADYNLGERFYEQDTYGIAFIQPSVILKHLQEYDSITVRGLSERGWDSQQDYLVIQKVPLNSKLDQDLRNP